MKLTLIVIGRSDDADLSAAIERYVKRLTHYASFALEEVLCPKAFSKLDRDELRREEGRLLLSRIAPQDKMILLDEKGSNWNSIDFAGQLQKWLNSGSKRVVFVIGGAFGFSDEVYARADHKLALSQMTLTHQMVRLFFVEQLYRGFTILKNEKYHH
jgi:23S rRNA (pseudouridine1915-N3)-methyltransferase